MASPRRSSTSSGSRTACRTCRTRARWTRPAPRAATCRRRACCCSRRSSPRQIRRGEPGAWNRCARPPHTPGRGTCPSDANAGTQDEAQAISAPHHTAHTQVYAAYKHLAKYFAQLGRLRTAEFFFKQCLHISREAAWLPGELEANLALGVVYEELRDTAAAIACHERRLELAMQHNLQVSAARRLPGDLPWRHSLLQQYHAASVQRHSA